MIKSRKANFLIFTGGYSPYESNLPLEGDVYIKKALSLGIDKSFLYSTTSASNTAEEAYQTKRLLQKKFPSSPKIILVTSAFHMKRAKKIFERQNIKVIPYPVDFQSKESFYDINFKNPNNWFISSINLHKSSLAIREIIGRIFYRTLF